MGRESFAGSLQIDNTIKHKLREIRKKKHLTMKEMAEFLNMSGNTYASYEQGAAWPHVKTLIYMANMLEVSLDTLVGRMNPELQVSPVELETMTVITDTQVDTESVEATKPNPKGTSVVTIHDRNRKDSGIHLNIDMNGNQLHIKLDVPHNGDTDKGEDL